jgi:hypothetical protein
VKRITRRQAREKLGVNFSRHEYTYADGLRALQRNGLDAS